RADGQHRDAVRFRHRVRGGADSALQAPRRASPIPVPGRDDPGPGGDPGKRYDDALPALGNMAAAGDLVARRPGHLLRLRLLEQLAREAHGRVDRGVIEPWWAACGLSAKPEAAPLFFTSR